MPTEHKHRSLLHQMTATTPTALWNDSCAMGELRPAIENNGAVGATCNPVIVLDVLKKEMHLWKDRIPQLIAENPRGSEDDLGWLLVEEREFIGSPDMASNASVAVAFSDEPNCGRVDLQYTQCLGLLRSGYRKIGDMLQYLKAF